MKPVSRKDAERVVAALADLLYLDQEDFFLADHEHEELAPGAWSIAFEGWSGDEPWTYYASRMQWERPELYPDGLFLEPKNSWCLAVYSNL